MQKKTEYKGQNKKGDGKAEATKWDKDTKGTQEEGFFYRGERSNMGECVEMEKCKLRGAHTNQSCGSNSSNNKNPIPKSCKR